MDILEYTNRPRMVSAVHLNKNNAAEVADWCSGEVIYSEDSSDILFLKIPSGDGMVRADVSYETLWNGQSDLGGDYVVKFEDGTCAPYNRGDFVKEFYELEDVPEVVPEEPTVEETPVEEEVIPEETPVEEVIPEETPVEEEVIPEGESIPEEPTDDPQEPETSTEDSVDEQPNNPSLEEELPLETIPEDSPTEEPPTEEEGISDESV